MHTQIAARKYKENLIAAKENSNELSSVAETEKSTIKHQRSDSSLRVFLPLKTVTPTFSYWAKRVT